MYYVPLKPQSVKKIFKKEKKRKKEKKKVYKSEAINVYNENIQTQQKSSIYELRWKNMNKTCKSRQVKTRPSCKGIGSC
jgi:phenylalanyl-tRNA synthetase beta subunit